MRKTATHEKYRGRVKRRPRIAVDATALSRRVTGAGRVLRSLVATLPAVDTKAEYVALATEEGAGVLPEDARVQVVAPSRGVSWELRGAAAAASAAGADLLFTIRELVGRRSPPTVLHVFEPPAYRLRAARPTKQTAKDALLAASFRVSVRRAAAVTAGSATTASWLGSRYGIKATTVLPGLEDAFFGTSDIPAARDEPYLLLLATGDPREETGVVLEALARLGADAPALVVAGVPDARRNDFARRRGVDVLGWVSDAELRSLYRGALALVHPARYEAYGGLAALEAMALGTPVVAFRAPGVTEALEGAALLVDAVDPELLAVALRRVANDPVLGAELAESGRRRVEPLRWERAAGEFAAAFHHVLNASS
jgi:glycosyltransferase involved in cell wall biosynthesis